MDINYWYLGMLVFTLVYIIPVLVIRAGIDRRKGNRRMGDRRVAVEMVRVDRRSDSADRRYGNRRG